MNDKEYTYDIGKYTIGVDTNGEDETGKYIAIGYFLRSKKDIEPYLKWSD